MAGRYQAVDLFGTRDLVAGGRRERALGLLDTLEPLYDLCGFTADQLLPVAVSRNDIDVFAMARPGSARAGSVAWLAGGLIDTFPNFDEYFLAMVDYNRMEAQRLEAKLRERRESVS